MKKTITIYRDDMTELSDGSSYFDVLIDALGITQGTKKVDYVTITLNPGLEKTRESKFTPEIYVYQTWYVGNDSLTACVMMTQSLSDAERYAAEGLTLGIDYKSLAETDIIVIDNRRI